MPQIKKDEKEKSKQRILVAAIKLFAQKGYDGAGIREICKEANANICMVSYFWGGKKELYNGIFEGILERQTQYVKTFLNFEEDFSSMTKQEKVEHLLFLADKIIDFFYSKEISSDLILFLLKAQQNSSSFFKKSSAFLYLRKLLASLFELEIDSREVVLKTVFLLSQINSPRIFASFAFDKSGQNVFSKEDIEIIKNNMKLYINALISEV